MTMDRKLFLRRLGTGAVGLAAATRLPAGAPAPQPWPPTWNDREPEAYWQAVRDEFLLRTDYHYFNTGGLGPAPRRVLAVLEQEMRRLQEESETGYSLFAPARAAVARWLGAAPAEIAFTRNATESNAIIASSLPLSAGDEVIFESHAHPGGSFPWLVQQRVRGVVVKLFEPDPASSQGNLRRIEALLTPRTRVVQVSHVTAPTGIVMPVAAIAAMCRERGIWFHIDGAQSAGMFPFTMAELGCDSFATSGHKWLGAPHETGFLWVRRDKLDRLVPVAVGGHSAQLEHLPGELRLEDTAIRFEYGTRNAAVARAVGAAVEFHEALGPARIAARGRELAARVRRGLSALPGIEILTPAAGESSGSIVSFRAAAVPFVELGERLQKEHRMRLRPVSEQGLNALRVSTHLFNLPAECDALVAAIGGMLGQARR